MTWCFFDAEKGGFLWGAQGLALKVQGARGGEARLVHRLIAQALIPFQSTRPRGARLISCQPQLLHNTFQSTRPHGARREVVILASRSVCISIHSPAWGETPPRCGGKETKNFNPLARRGRDWTDKESVRQYNEFQSTRPQGARPTPLASNWPIRSFQSTRPQGARQSASKTQREKMLFQSTRPQGARHQCPLYMCAGYLFQSTHPQGARPGRRSSRSSPLSFQSTRPQGARPVPQRLCHVLDHFNPLARRGRDQRSSAAVAWRTYFNPLARRGRDPVRVLYRWAMGNHFNPLARRGRDDANRYIPGTSAYFNPLARRGRDVRIHAAGDFNTAFQSTRPQGARRQGERTKHKSLDDFNPLARRGRDMSKGTV